MTTLNLEPILHSPRLPGIVAVLNARLRLEAECRQRFYEDMADDQKVEFIGGEVVMHSPARNRHLVAKMSLTTLLDAYVELHGLGAVRDEKCLCVFPRNDYEPDIVFFDSPKAALFHSETMKFPVPDLAVEVLSEGNTYAEMARKRREYFHAGVRQVWMIDIEERTVAVYSDITQHQIFDETQNLTGGDILPGLEISLTTLFGELDRTRP